MSKKMRITGATTNRIAPSVIVLMVAIALLCGVSAGFVLTKSMIPPTLVSSSRGGTIDPQRSEYDDTRNATVTVAPGAAQTVAAPIQGRLTVMDCNPGDTVSSGTSILSIDDVPQLMLYADRPPYRSLASGMNGADAAAINAELRRLGYAAPDGDTMTWDTIAAYNELARNVGATPLTADTRWILTPSSFIWLRQPSSVITACPASLGQQVDPSTQLFSVNAVPTTVQITLPEKVAVSGDRVMVIGKSSFDMPSGTTQMQDIGFIDAVLGSNEYKVAQQAMAAKDVQQPATSSSPGSVQVTFRWRLKQAAQVWEVPPGTLYDIRGTSACVVSGGSAKQVSIVSSELGKTMIAHDGALRRVSLDPDASKPCR